MNNVGEDTSVWNSHKKCENLVGKCTIRHCNTYTAWEKWNFDCCKKGYHMMMLPNILF